jgi:hypothetical protein
MKYLLSNAKFRAIEAYEAALDRAEKMLSDFHRRNPAACRRIILIGDGDVNAEYFRGSWENQCQRLRKNGVPVHSLIIGSSLARYQAPGINTQATISRSTGGIYRLVNLNDDNTALFDSEELIGFHVNHQTTTETKGFQLGPWEDLTEEERKAHANVLNRFDAMLSAGNFETETLAVVARKLAYELTNAKTEAEKREAEKRKAEKHDIETKLAQAEREMGELQANLDYFKAEVDRLRLQGTYGTSAAGTVSSGVPSKTTFPPPHGYPNLPPRPRPKPKHSSIFGKITKNPGGT